MLLASVRFEFLIDDLNLGLGVCGGRSFFTIDRLSIGNVRIHLCFDFRQGLAYAGLFGSRQRTSTVSSTSDFRQESNVVPYTRFSQNST